LFNAIQRGIETAMVAARWAAKPLTTAPSLIAYTVTSLEFVAFRFHLAALRAHDLNQHLKNTFLNASYEGRLEWGVDRLLSRSWVG